MTRYDICWILGSGFSVPLGGPTLNQVLSFAVTDEFMSRDALKDHERQLLTTVEGAWLPLQAARALYHWGTGYASGEFGSNHQLRKQHEQYGATRLWCDPEDFLQRLESVTQDASSGAASVIQRGLNRISKISNGRTPTLSELYNAATACLALQCCFFLRGADTRSERWLPYRRWKDGLLNEDTVLTFNYDPIPELLGLEGNVCEPGTPKGVEIVFKLHGSTTWRKQGSTVRASSPPPDDFSLLAATTFEEFAIAPPGGKKLTEAQSSFSELWTSGIERLKNAGAVVIVGYRMPETDAKARREIMGALADFNGPIHIVLGDNIQHPHVRRLVGMLKFVAPKAQVIAHPLFAQDFLALYRRRQILDPSSL